MHPAQFGLCDRCALAFDPHDSLFARQIPRFRLYCLPRWSISKPKFHFNGMLLHRISEVCLNLTSIAALLKEYSVITPQSHDVMAATIGP